MITILLASYNGERYIGEQIESILKQSYQDFVLYIQDDRSTDRTYEIICGYASAFPDKVKVSQNQVNTGNAKFNFLNMMVDHEDEYLMLCDQDDVWLPDKIEKTLICMQEAEKRYGIHTPLLVYTDLKVADEQLNVLSESMMHRVAADFTKTSLKDQLPQNTLTGCTALYNRALAERIREVPEFTVMHDWWLMLIAAGLGHAVYFSESTMLYRQHGDNSVGTRNMRSAGFLARFAMRSDIIRKALDESYLQAESFYHCFGEELDQKDAELVKAYAGLRTMSKPERILTLFHLGTWKQGILRQIGQIIYC